MLLHCRSGLLKLHPMSTEQEAVDSCCILFVPYFQSGSCLKPQNHNISLLEICNSDQQGSAACLRPIKHEVGWMPPTEMLISSTFSTQKPTYWLQQALQICIVTNSELQFLEIRNKSLYPAPGIVLWWCREPTCMFTPLACLRNWTNQLPLAAHPEISFSLDKKVEPSNLQRGHGWLGGFFKYILILVTLQLLVFKEKLSQRACKNPQTQLPVSWGALYHKYWI